RHLVARVRRADADAEVAAGGGGAGDLAGGASAALVVAGAETGDNFAAEPWLTDVHAALRPRAAVPAAAGAAPVADGAVVRAITDAARRDVSADALGRTG